MKEPELIALRPGLTARAAVYNIPAPTTRLASARSFSFGTTRDVLESKDNYGVEISGCDDTGSPIELTLTWQQLEELIGLCQARQNRMQSRYAEDSQYETQGEKDL